MICEKRMGNCEICDSSWDRFVEKYPDAIVETKWGNKISQDKYVEQLKQACLEGQVECICWEDSVGDKVAVCISCMESFINSSRTELK